MIKNFALLFFVIILFCKGFAQEKKGDQEFYELKIYHFINAEQEKALDNYFAAAYLPALHKAGIKTVGVFKPLSNDTAANKRLYVLIPLKSAGQITSLPEQLQKDPAYMDASGSYADAAYDRAPYLRMESVLLRAFNLSPKITLPVLQSRKDDRIYELRSYEGPTEKLYRKKVQMFNEGGEIALFKRLQFNGIFYADVISGSNMPNLMYMTSFENMPVRDEHWQTFKNDPEWKVLSAKPEYQHTVSRQDIILMHATAYSDF